MPAGKRSAAESFGLVISTVQRSPEAYHTHFELRIWHMHGRLEDDQHIISYMMLRWTPTTHHRVSRPLMNGRRIVGL